MTGCVRKIAAVGLTAYFCAVVVRNIACQAISAQAKTVIAYTLPKSRMPRVNKQGPGKIEYLTHTWGVISGCLHDCEYCYMKRKAARFPTISTVPAFHPEKPAKC